MNAFRIAWAGRTAVFAFFALLALLAVMVLGWHWGCPPQEEVTASDPPSRWAGRLRAHIADYWTDHLTAHLTPPWTDHWTPYLESGKFGYVDSHGATRIPPQFDGADGFCDGRARVLVSGRFGFIDTSGSMIIPARFYWATSFRGGYASVWNGDQWDYLDRQGRALQTQGPLTQSSSKAL